MSLRNLKYKINFYFYFFCIRVPKFYIKLLLFYIFKNEKLEVHQTTP